MIFYTPNNKMAGELKEGVYRKIVKGSKHLFRAYNAYGIEKIIINKLKGDCEEIRIKDTETGNIYATTYDNFVDKGIEHDWGTPQVFLPLKYFAITSTKQNKLI